MKKSLHFTGTVKRIDYDPQLRTGLLPKLDFNTLDINDAPPSGMLVFDEETMFPYCKWLSPKPSRSYASARTYTTYHLSKMVTVIPVLKDEGGGSQNNDRMTFTTLSRMNLMNVHIVLTWYDSAQPHDRFPNRIRDQQLNQQFVLDRLREIKRYKLSAHHWNEMHFARDYEMLFRRAVESYQEIGRRHGLVMHPAENHLRLLEKAMVDGRFNIDAFAEQSSKRSSRSTKSEAVTLHELEHLSDGRKASFDLNNFLGGRYHLTADEVFWEGDRLIVQESKNNSRGALPSLAATQDGLFKNILFMNIGKLVLEDSEVQFETRVKLTGILEGRLRLPADDRRVITSFAKQNQLSQDQVNLLHMLQKEVIVNPGFTIEIASNK